MAQNKDQVEYLTPTEIAYILRQRTGKKWTPVSINQKLAEMGYQIKPFYEWQPTAKGIQFANFSSRMLKWNREIIDLIEKL
ncbi:MAG TPA: hypothetical protein VK203_24995 [Nostocaceae cyanobacterium]|nr:hypothetical protein [Nostocaceae cyanobacterium]